MKTSLIKLLKEFTDLSNHVQYLINQVIDIENQFAQNNNPKTQNTGGKIKIIDLSICLDSFSNDSLSSDLNLDILIFPAILTAFLYFL